MINEHPLARNLFDHQGPQGQPATFLSAQAENRSPFGRTSPTPSAGSPSFFAADEGWEMSRLFLERGHPLSLCARRPTNYASTNAAAHGGSGRWAAVGVRVCWANVSPDEAAAWIGLAEALTNLNPPVAARATAPQALTIANEEANDYLIRESEIRIATPPKQP